MQNSNNDLWPVIMAGGSGTRLWPISRTTMPKQFCSINGEETLFYKTLERAVDLNTNNPIIIITNIDYKFFVIKELEKFDVEYRLILEPLKRNTAAAIAIASMYVKKFSDNQKLLILSADHSIDDKEQFQLSVINGSKHIDKESLLTFGAKAISPETGYGYIQYIESNDLIKSVKNFVEKPKIDLAKEYIKKGNYLWNTGIFMFYAETMLEELEKFEPLVSDVCQNIIATIDNQSDYIHELNEDIFSKFPDISIDYAVFEKTKIAKVLLIMFDWSDMGTWPMIWKNFSEKDHNRNALIGKVNVINSNNSLLVAQHKRISAIGIENIAIIDTPDALLVSSMDAIDGIKPCVEEIIKDDPMLVSEHRKVYRPWGWYDSLEKDIGHQVKRIHVYPSQKLSVQRHKHRAERWVVIKGVATVTLDDKDYEYNVGDVVQINIMQIHSLANNTQNDLEIIEVQLGDYLGEDDIERFEDIYGRT